MTDIKNFELKKKTKDEQPPLQKKKTVTFHDDSEDN